MRLCYKREHVCCLLVGIHLFRIFNHCFSLIASPLGFLSFLSNECEHLPHCTKESCLGKRWPFGHKLSCGQSKMEFQYMVNKHTDFWSFQMIGAFRQSKASNEYNKMSGEEASAWSGVFLLFCEMKTASNCIRFSAFRRNEYPRVVQVGGNHFRVWV